MKHSLWIFLVLFLFGCWQPYESDIPEYTTNSIWQYSPIKEYMRGDLCWLGYDSEQDIKMRWESLQDYNIGNRPWGYNIPPDGLGWHEMSPEWWKRIQ